MAQKESLTLRNQEYFLVENDCRTANVEFEDWDAAEKIGNILWRDAVLAGEFVFSDEVKSTIRSSAETAFSKLLKSPKNYLTAVEMQILALEAVILTQEMDEGEDTKLWSHIFESLGYDASMPDMPSFQLLYSRYREVLTDVIKGHGRIFADFEKSKLYYNTLNIHALSPDWSVEHLLNILYAFYARNLEFQYEPCDNAFNLLVQNIAKRWDAEKQESEEKMKLRADTLASGLKMLFTNRPHYMAAVCDALTERLDFVLKCGTEQLDLSNRWNMLLKCWYNKKTTAEQEQMNTSRKRASRERVATRKEDIRPQYYLSGEDVYINIPRIRLPEVTTRPVARLEQNGVVVKSNLLSVFGDDLCLTTHEYSFLLDEKIDWQAPLHFEIRILCGEEEIYASGAELFRKYILFADSGHELRGYQRGTPGFCLLTDQKARVEICPSEEDCTQRNADGQLWQINMSNIEHLLVDGTDVLAQGQGRGEVFCFLAPEGEKNVQIVSDGVAYQVLSGPSTLTVLLPEGQAPQEYGIYIDSMRHSLHEYGQGGTVEVSLPHQPNYFHQVELRNFNSGKSVFRVNYILLSDFSYHFDREIYPNKYDTAGSVTVHCRGNSKRMDFALEQDQRELAFELWKGAVCHLEIPKLNAVLFGENGRMENAFLLEENTWHGAFTLADFVRLDVPGGFQARLFLAGMEISRQRSHYELGNFLRSRTDWGAEELPLGILVYHNSQQICQEFLTNVFFKERFLKNPVCLVETAKEDEVQYTIEWVPEQGYIGGENPEFRVDLDNDQGGLWNYRVSLKKSTIEKRFPCRDGVYHYQVYLHGKKRFLRSEPDRLLLEGDLQIGDPNRSRFTGQELRLRKVCFWSCLEKKEKMALLRDGEAVLRDFEYMGKSAPADGEEPCCEYEAELGFVTYDRTYHPLNYDEFSDRFEWINPVRIWIVNEKKLLLHTCGGVSMMVNTKKVGDGRHARLVSAFAVCEEMSKEEQYKFINDSDYFEYEIVPEN